MKLFGEKKYGMGPNPFISVKMAERPHGLNGNEKAQRPVLTKWPYGLKLTKRPSGQIF